MTTQKNPYSAPVAKDREENKSSSVAGVLTNGLPGRIGIRVVLRFFGFLALMSLLLFAYQSTYVDQFGGSYFRTNPMWVISHLVRGVGMTILSWQLFCYVRLIRNIATASDLQMFARRHAILWNWGAIVLVAIAGYSTVFAILMTMTS